jgi:hypothetical protein
MYPVRKKRSGFGNLEHHSICERIVEESKENGLPDLSLTQVKDVIWFFEKEMFRNILHGNAIFISFIGYFTPSKSRVNADRKVRERKADIERREQNFYNEIYRIKKKTEEDFAAYNKDLLSKDKLPVSWNAYCRSVQYTTRINIIKRKIVRVQGKRKRFNSFMSKRFR